MKEEAINIAFKAITKKFYPGGITAFQKMKL
jgi:hypothetical protein